MIETKWVFALKTSTTGQIEKYKARLVIQGFRQQPHEYGETYSPVIRGASEIIAMAAVWDMELHQMDVKTALRKRSAFGNQRDSVMEQEEHGR